MKSTWKKLFKRNKAKETNVVTTSVCATGGATSCGQECSTRNTTTESIVEATVAGSEAKVTTSTQSKSVSLDNANVAKVESVGVQEDEAERSMASENTIVSAGGHNEFMAEEVESLSENSKTNEQEDEGETEEAQPSSTTVEQVDALTSESQKTTVANDEDNEVAQTDSGDEIRPEVHTTTIIVIEDNVESESAIGFERSFESKQRSVVMVSHDVVGSTGSNLENEAVRHNQDNETESAGSVNNDEQDDGGRNCPAKRKSLYNLQSTVSYDRESRTSGRNQPEQEEQQEPPCLGRDDYDDDVQVRLP